ncbi:hypothetical protein [Bacillus alkalicellulosilyticus]|uniref:hypothetical protein n=1 Tax=Alkalihalobacterium alkalicellulosilyticum TaxID=1912214 RepID=UPI000997506F|nr:hypothetical protein [Bacillus alkalicellulosilyticus]
MGPFLYFYLNQKKLAFANLLFITSSLVIWFCLIAGWVSEQFWIVMWNATLLVSVLFLVIAVSIIFLRIVPINRFLLPFILLVISGVCLMIWDTGSHSQMHDLTHYLFWFFIPLFVTVILIIGAIQNDKRNEQREV